MTKFLFILILVCTGLSSCNKNEENPKTEAGFLSELKDSPEVISTGNNSITLEADLSRDFMPICEENGNPLYCIIDLKNLNNSDLNEEITLKKIYVINGDEFWSKMITETNMSATQVTGIANNGPKWEPDLAVDVVCEFEYKGVIQRVISKNENIYAVQ